MAEWHGGFFANCHKQFVKGGPPWRCHKAQWHVYMAEFQSSDNSALDTYNFITMSYFHTDMYAILSHDLINIVMS